MYLLGHVLKVWYLPTKNILLPIGYSIIATVGDRSWEYGISNSCPWCSFQILLPELPITHWRTSSFINENGLFYWYELGVMYSIRFSIKTRVYKWKPFFFSLRMSQLAIVYVWSCRKLKRRNGDVSISVFSKFIKLFTINWDIAQ